MELKDYLLADCTLYRTPTLDFSAINSQIEKLILDSWNNGGSIDNVINNLVENYEITTQMSEQLGNSMTFQRKAYLESIRQKQNLENEKYNQENTQKLREVTTRYDTDISKTKKLLDATSEEYSKNREEYSAAQSRINAARERIKNNLAQVGGREKLSNLMAINATLMGDDSYKSVNEKVLRSVKVATSDKVIDPLNGKTIDRIVLESESTKHESKGFFGRVFKKIFGGKSYDWYHKW